MEFNRQNIRSKVSVAETHVIDEGLRAYMLKVYNYMASGVFLTGIVSLILFQLSGGYNIQITSLGITGLTSIGNALYNSALMWVVMLAPLGVVFYMSFGIAKMSSSKAQTVFWVFAALMGASLSSIFLVYTGASITRVFFITAGTFAAMSIWLYHQKGFNKTWFILNDGFNRNNNCINSKYFYEIYHDVFCNFYNWSINICWADRL
jgi:hypothetical protein